MAWLPSQIDDPRRREMILRAVGGESVLDLAREYDMSRTQVYRARERALEDPGRDLESARAEVEFWGEVRGLV